MRAAGVDNERLADGDDTLLGSGNGALEHDVVVLDNTVVGEATHGSNALLRDVMLSRGVGVVVAPANAVDLLVELRAVVVTVCKQQSVYVLYCCSEISAYFDRHGQQRT